MAKGRIARRREQRADPLSLLPERHIYIDESGFTGPDLLDPAQPWVSYGAVMVEPEASAAMIEQVSRDNRNLFQSGELKARNLLRSARGRRVALGLLTEIAPNSRVAIHHKRFALAANFVEYVYEPALSKKWWPLVYHGFNRFVATEFYSALSRQNKVATDLERAFRLFMDGQGDGRFWKLLEVALNDESMGIHFRRIAYAALHLQDYAEKEVKSVAEHGYGRWILDLSITSLFGLLNAIPVDAHTSLIVVCDESKPLRAMGASLRGVMPFNDRVHVPNGISFGDSAKEPGLQLADLVAGTALHVQYLREDANLFVPLINAMTIPASVRPGYPYKYASLNSEIVSLLASYALNGFDPAAKYQAFLDDKLPVLLERMEQDLPELVPMIVRPSDGDPRIA